jgi:DNA-directed RNA polymerase specialized sigma24 family protein
MAALSRAFADQLDATVRALPSLSSQEQERVISGALRDLLPHVQGWSTRLCRVNGDVYLSYSDDVISESLMAVWSTLRAIAAGDRQVTSVYEYLYGVAVYAAGAYFKSTAVTGLSGQTTLVRTHRRFSFLSEQISIAELRPATAGEIAEAVNRQTQERRTNPKKDRVITEAEVRAWMADRDGTVRRKSPRGARGLTPRPQPTERNTP